MEIKGLEEIRKKNIYTGAIQRKSNIIADPKKETKNK